MASDMIPITEAATAMNFDEEEFERWLRQNKISVSTRNGLQYASAKALNTAKNKWWDAWNFSSQSVVSEAAGKQDWVPYSLGTSITGLGSGDFEDLVNAGIVRGRNWRASKDVDGKSVPTGSTQRQISLSSLNAAAMNEIKHYDIPDFVSRASLDEGGAERRYSQKQVAQLHGVTEAQVVRDIYAGRLEAETEGGKFWIDPQSALVWKPAAVAEPTEDWFDESDIEDIFQISKGTTTRWIAQGKIAAQKFEGKWRIDPASVQGFVEMERSRFNIADFAPTVIATEGAEGFEPTEAGKMAIATSRGRDNYLYEPTSRGALSLDELNRLTAGGGGEYARSMRLRPGSAISVGEYNEWVETLIKTPQWVVPAGELGAKDPTRVRRALMPSFLQPQRARETYDLVKRYMKPSELGQAFNVPASTVRGWLTSGRMAGEQVGGRWRVHIDDANRFKEDMLGSYAGLDVKFMAPPQYERTEAPMAGQYQSPRPNAAMEWLRQTALAKVPNLGAQWRW